MIVPFLAHLCIAFSKHLNMQWQFTFQIKTDWDSWMWKSGWMKHRERAPMTRVSSWAGTSGVLNPKGNNNKKYTKYKKSPAPAVIIHHASNVFTFSSFGLYPVKPACGFCAGATTTNSNGCRTVLGWHKCTFTPFQRHCFFIGTGLAPVLPTGNFHFSSWQSPAGNRTDWRTEEDSTKMVTGRKK